jgi:glycosyltransferase involved in cell wall biosynthesis
MRDNINQANTVPQPPADNPLVSVVIPTLCRPELVQRAIRGALAQTHQNLEVIVVSDGPDPETAAILHHPDPRVRYLQLPERSGPAAARNAGIQLSNGAWINLLDDDDELLPTKVAAQLAIANPADTTTLIACRTIYQQSGRQNIWPARPIAPDEPLGDYLLRRPGLRGRPGAINLHTLLIPRALALAVPQPHFPDHEDWAWLLAAHHLAGATVQFLWEPLVVYHLAPAELTRSRRTNWAESLAWADAHRHWLSRPAYNSFLATKVALKARRGGGGVATIAGKVLRNHPSPLDLAFLLAIAATPTRLSNWAWQRSLKSSAATRP